MCACVCLSATALQLFKLITAVQNSQPLQATGKRLKLNSEMCGNMICLQQQLQVQQQQLLQLIHQLFLQVNITTQHRNILQAENTRKLFNLRDSCMPESNKPHGAGTHKWFC